MKFRLIEQILTEDIEAVKKLYPTIPDELFDLVVKADPTYREGSNSVGKYTKWLLNMLKKGEISKDIDGWENKETYSNTTGELIEVPVALGKFDRLKSTLPNRDINQFRTIQDFIDTVDSLSEDNLTARQKERRTRNAYKDAKLVFESPNWVVYTPTSYEGSCTLGKGTSWCTAYSLNDYYYNHYSSRGPLYVVINKKDPSEKYQFHFETNSFMDAKDIAVKALYKTLDKETCDFFLPMAKKADCDYLFKGITTEDLLLTTVDGWKIYEARDNEEINALGLDYILNRNSGILFITDNTSNYIFEIHTDDPCAFYVNGNYTLSIKNIDLPESVWEYLCKYYDVPFVVDNIANNVIWGNGIYSDFKLTYSTNLPASAYLFPLSHRYIARLPERFIKEVEGTFGLVKTAFDVFDSLDLGNNDKWVSFLASNLEISEDVARELLSRKQRTYSFSQLIESAFYWAVAREYQIAFMSQLSDAYSKALTFADNEVLAQSVHSTKRIEKANGFFNPVDLPLYDITIDTSSLSWKNRFGMCFSNMVDGDTFIEYPCDVMNPSLGSYIASNVINYIGSSVASVSVDINDCIENLQEKDFLLCLQYCLSGMANISDFKQQFNELRDLFRVK